MIKRKQDHLNLALKSQVNSINNDKRFDYEPLLKAHPKNTFKPFDFLGKKMKVPIWISSMTGGAEYAGIINMNLARACNEFGMGMGLGSCRALLEEGKYYDHFNLRDVIGDEFPFYANLGISQIETAILNNNTSKITDMVKTLRADGLIIHINPLQEWLQPEGDKITIPPIETIKSFLEKENIRIIVKEVGQGMGPRSLKSLLQLPLEAIELAAYGGTNFAAVELMRSDPIKQQLLEPISYLGNNVYQMINDINQIVQSDIKIKCESLIISGGIKTFLDGYYLIEKSNIKAVYGQASAMLQYAREKYHQLKEYIQHQINGLELATNYLHIKEI